MHRKQHLHLSEQESRKICDDLYKDTVMLIRKTQQDLFEKKYCENDFMAILTSYAVRTASNAIVHIAKASDMNMAEVIDMIIGGAIKAVGVEYVTLKVEEVIEQMNATQH